MRGGKREMWLSGSAAVPVPYPCPAHGHGSGPTQDLREPCGGCRDVGLASAAGAQELQPNWTSGQRGTPHRRSPLRRCARGPVGARFRQKDSTEGRRHSGCGTANLPGVKMCWCSPCMRQCSTAPGTAPRAVPAALVGTPHQSPVWFAKCANSTHILSAWNFGGRYSNYFVSKNEENTNHSTRKII